MLTTVLIPHAVAESCYLYESFLWLAVRRFPLAIGTERADDIRKDDDYVEGLEPHLPFDEPLTDEECARLGVPADPERKTFEDGDFYQTPENLRSLLRRGGGTATLDARWQKELEESEEYYRRKLAWENEFETAADVHKCKLFLALREGQVGASGKKLPKATYADSVKHLEATEWRSWDDIDWSPISADFWISNRIDWENCRAEGKSVAYALVLVNFEQLFKCFPPTAEPAGDYVKYGDVLAPRSGAQQAPTPKSARGRPPLSWDSFHLEVARRLTQGQLPVKQESFVAEMQEWCRTKWHREVGRSTVLSKIKPYYDEFIRKSENTGR